MRRDRARRRSEAGRIRGSFQARGLRGFNGRGWTSPSRGKARQHLRGSTGGFRQFAGQHEPQTHLHCSDRAARAAKQTDGQALGAQFRLTNTRSNAYETWRAALASLDRFQHSNSGSYHLIPWLMRRSTSLQPLHEERSGFAICSGPACLLFLSMTRVGLASYFIASTASREPQLRLVDAPQDHQSIRHSLPRGCFR